MNRPFPLACLLALFFLAPAAQAQVSSHLMRSYSKLTSKTDKLVGKVNPWSDLVKKNETLIGHLVTDQSLCLFLLPNRQYVPTALRTPRSLALQGGPPALEVELPHAFGRMPAPATVLGKLLRPHSPLTTAHHLFATLDQSLVRQAP